MKKFIDITNQRFGYLTALYPTRLNGRFAWHCRCDCGKECDVDSDALRHNRIKSCGCKKNEIISKKISKDLSGQKFNHLTVIEKTDKRLSGSIVWKCQCDCGNITYVSSGNLCSGHTKTCGKCSLRNENISKLQIKGKRFGHLTVVDYLGVNQNSETIWLCKCDCGNFCESIGWHLTKGISNSCGCLKLSLGEEKIASLLNEHKIPFECQKTFETCRFPDTNQLAKFDFFVDNRYIIEYDGEQHFLPLDENKGYYTKEKIEKIKEYDKFKTEWCKQNNISLIRIPYTKYSELTITDLIL